MVEKCGPVDFIVRVRWKTDSELVPPRARVARRRPQIPEAVKQQHPTTVPANEDELRERALDLANSLIDELYALICGSRYPGCEADFETRALVLATIEDLTEALDLADYRVGSATRPPKELVAALRKDAGFRRYLERLGIGETNDDAGES